MKNIRYALVLMPLCLGACGDGWEMVRTDAFPYGNQRTAGTGVAYVLARMEPPKQELIIEPQMSAPAVDVIFNDLQKK